MFDVKTRASVSASPVRQDADKLDGATIADTDGTDMDAASESEQTSQSSVTSIE